VRDEEPNDSGLVSRLTSRTEGAAHQERALPVVIHPDEIAEYLFTFVRATYRCRQPMNFQT
jgi:hypothetical protein